MNTKLMRYYKKKLYGGRSIAARITDFIVLRAFLLFIIFVIVLYYSLSTVVALLISVFLTTAVSLAIMAYNKKRIEGFIIKDMQRLKRKCLLEKLTFMDAQDYAQYINDIFGGNIKNTSVTDEGFSGEYKGKNIYALHSHPGSECTVCDVLKILRGFGREKDIIIVSLSEFNAEAKRMCKSLPVNVELVGGDSILKTAEKLGLISGEEEAEKDAQREMNDTVVTLEKVKRNALGRTKIKGYVLCGIIIMCWPLVSGFKIYYPIIAILCFVMALLTHRRSKLEAKESSDIGIS